MPDQAAREGGRPAMQAVIACAACHPDVAMRDAARDTVERAVGADVVREAVVAIRDLVTSVADDPLEPLVLTASDVWVLAVLQVGSWRANRSVIPQLRVVGRDAIGCGGGVLLEGWRGVARLRRVAASGEPVIHRSPVAVMDRIDAWVRVSTACTAAKVVRRDRPVGFELTMPDAVLNIDRLAEALYGEMRGSARQALLSDLQRFSCFMPSGATLDRHGFRVELRRDGLTLCSGSSASLMQASEAFATRGVLSLRGRRTVGVVLTGIGEHAMKCFRCHDAVRADWTNVTIEQDAAIDDALMKAIAAWCGPHSLWATPKFLESVS